MAEMNRTDHMNVMREQEAKKENDDCLDCYEKYGECGDHCLFKESDRIPSYECDGRKENQNYRKFDLVKIMYPGDKQENSYNYDLFLEWLENYYNLIFNPHPYMIIYVGYEDSSFHDHSFYATMFLDNKKIIIEYDYIDVTLKINGSVIPSRIPVWNAGLE